MPSSTTATEDPFTLVTSPAQLGAAIRRARAALGLSQDDVARRCRVGRRFVVELEQGKPSVRFDKALAVMAGVGILPFLVPLEVIKAVYAQRG